MSAWREKFRVQGLEFRVLILITLFCGLFLTILALPVQAIDNPTSQSALPATGMTLRGESPTVTPAYTDALVSSLFHTFSCLAVGQSVIGQPCLTYQVTRNAQGAIQGVPVLSQVDTSNGALGATASMIGLLYTDRPIKTADYLGSLGEQFGVVKEAHAQVIGSGEAVLHPILLLWQISRNISYLIMITIFVVIGLMVMFRNRINPQTVITAQAALPGLVLGLILITFSYFLAGLISDTAFLGTNIVGAYYSMVKGQPDKPQDLVKETSNDSVLSLFSNFVGIVTQDQAANAVSAVFDKLGSAAQNQLRILIGFLGAQFVGPLTGAIPPPWGLIAKPIIDTVTGLTVAATPAFTLGWVLSFIATIALIYQMLRLLLRLLTSYLTIIFLTISAPFQFLFASLPGRQGIATGWILNILSNVLVFPAVLAVFYFIAFILGQSYGPFRVSSLNQPNSLALVASAQEQKTGPIKIIDSNTFPLFGGLDLAFVRILLAFGALMALPAIPDIVVRSIGKASQAGQLIGQELQGGLRAGQGYARQEQGAVAGYGSSMNRALFGQKQWQFTERGWVPYYGQPGLLNWREKAPPSTGGAGRTIS